MNFFRGGHDSSSIIMVFYPQESSWKWSILGQIKHKIQKTSKVKIFKHKKCLEFPYHFKELSLKQAWLS